MCNLKLKDTFFYFLLLGCFSTSFGQDNPPSIVATGLGEYCPGGTVSVADSVTITDPDVGDTNLDLIVVQISQGYSNGQDQLILSGVHPNISSSWDANQGKLTLSGNASFAEYEAALEAVNYQTTQVIFVSDKTFSINIGNANYLPSTGHYYFYVEDLSITWEQAKAAASASTYYGLQGYLATLATSEEALLAGTQSSGSGWIGASDSETEGLWKWVTGPEEGTVFWFGDFSGAPQNGEFSFWNIGEPNDLNDEDYAHITEPGIGFPGAWNDLSVTGDNDINSSYHPQGYIVEYGGMPGDPIVNLSTSTSISTPRITSINHDGGCANETISLSVTSNTDTAVWFETQNSTTVLHQGFTYSPSVSFITVFWVAPVFDGCTGGLRIPVIASVDELPEANDITILNCDDSVIFDGLTVFNINAYYNTITGGTTSDRTINYFSDAALTQAIDGNNYNNITNPQIVFAEVINPNTGCVNVSEITLEVNTSVANNTMLEICDDNLGDGIETFVLSDADTQILTGLPAGLTTSYYVSYDDALLEQNQLPNNYDNTTPFNQTIYVRIGQGNTCYGISEVELMVNAIFPVISNETVFYCLNTFPNTITLSAQVLNPNYALNWSTGETTESIEVNQTGDYTVEIINNTTLCSQTRTITVLASSVAVIESVDVVDVSQNNSITVNVEGEGVYEYALNINGPYQTSNAFLNVETGEYTVYVKDVKNDCGIVSRSVFVLGYPDFFTPNNDTYNDTWQIKGVPTNLQGAFKVNIYNRFGKLLYSMDNPNDSWDGTYNGVKLPTSDYWFTAFLGRGKYFSGHFTLKVN